MIAKAVSEPNQNLGRITAIYGVQPAYLQRAVFVVVLSFLFFLGTMVIFYLQQGFVYFILSTAFLVIYIVTMTSWVLQRRNVVKLYENGIEYRKFSLLWNEIEPRQQWQHFLTFQCWQTQHRPDFRRGDGTGTMPPVHDRRITT